MKPLWPSHYRPPRHSLVEFVADQFGVTPALIRGPRRYAALVDARAVISKVLRERGEISYPVIGRVLGNRDHTTIIHYCKTFDKRAERNPMVSDIFRRARLASS